MLFMVQARAKSYTKTERLARRAHFEYPEGIKVVAEYWPMGSDIVALLIAEAEDMAAIMAAVYAWSDALDLTINPVVNAEEGLRLANAKKLIKGP